MSRVLLADVGGSNVRFALADTTKPDPLERDSVRRYRVAAFPGFADAARQYLVDCGVNDVDSDLVDRGYVARSPPPSFSGARPRHAVFAFAGPVLGDLVTLTNHAWTISLSNVQRELGLESVYGVNDFAAMAHSIALLGDDEVQAIGANGAPKMATDSDQTFVVIGPGTGLGIAALLRRDGALSVLETEGGHMGFAPSNILEQDLLRLLSARYGRVTNEHLLSGDGLVNVYWALSEIAGSAAEELTPEDITRRADDGSCARCVETVDRCCEIFGAVAGDFVLAYGGWNGAYLAGGIAPLLLPWLQAGGFRRRFEEKGCYAPLMTKVPTAVICHPDPGLLGTAALAAIRHGADVAVVAP